MLIAVISACFDTVFKILQYYQNYLGCKVAFYASFPLVAYSSLTSTGFIVFVLQLTKEKFRHTSKTVCFNCY